MSQDRFLSVTNQVKQIIMQSPNPEAAANQIWEMVQHYKAAYQNTLVENNAESVAFTFNNLIQEHLDNLINDPQVKVSCKSGCAYCCYQNVDITREEAKLILSYCEDKGIPIDWNSLNKQIPGIQNISYKDRKCVFLGEGNKCSIYEHRPHMCRKYYVGSPAESCNSEIEPDGGVMVMTANFAEVISNAILEATDSGPIANMLIKVNNEK